jgi:hypothetical protein
VLERNLTKMKHIFRVSIILATTIFLVLFYGFHRNNYLPGISIPLGMMNNEMELTAPAQVNKFEIGQTIWLVVKNQTEFPIIYFEEKDLKVFTRVNGQWVELENSYAYPDFEMIIGPKSDDDSNMGLVSLRPVYEGSTSIDVRIVLTGVSGNEMQGRNPVGAFVDVSLSLDGRNDFSG